MTAAQQPKQTFDHITDAGLAELRADPAPLLAFRAEVERKIRDLQALKAELDSIIDQCSCGTVADCRIIDSLSPKH